VNEIIPGEGGIVFPRMLCDRFPQNKDSHRRHQEGCRSWMNLPAGPGDPPRSQKRCRKSLRILHQSPWLCTLLSQGLMCKREGN